MIHPKIKELLGFNPNQSDTEFLNEWREKVKNIQKPCWDLKYCPYGPLVEQFPLLPPLKKVTLVHHEYLKNCLEKGIYGDNQPLDNTRREFFEKTVADFNPEDYPEEIPSEIAYWQCLIFGHICPVVYSVENIAEEPPK
jgi:hypothetical protein